MRSVDFNAANAYPGEPQGWDRASLGPCEALPVVTDGLRFVSVWSLETGDIERLKAGANVLLTCVGGQLPVCLEVADPSIEGYWEKGTMAKGLQGYSGDESVAPGDGKVLGLPVAGYRPQTTGAVGLVDVNKALEERILRRIDELQRLDTPGEGATCDQRMLALARTGIQEAFMWLNRAVFQPARLSDEDLARIEGSDGC